MNYTFNQVFNKMKQGLLSGSQTLPYFQNSNYKELTILGDFEKILHRIPPYEGDQYIPPYWLHSELIQRFNLLNQVKIQSGMNILEIGCGPHLLTTIPLAYRVGKSGRVIAIDRTRWHAARSLLEVTDLKNRVVPLKISIQNFSVPYKAFSLAISVHAFRSYGTDEEIVSILKKLKQTSNRIIIAESLPIAHTPAQRAHLEMYNLRGPIFKAINGRIDDYPYRSMKKLIQLIRQAGLIHIDSHTIELKLPHFLATIPQNFIQKIKNSQKQKELLEKWQHARKKIER